MELEEIVKILIALVVLVVLIGGVIFLFSGKGGEVFSAIRDFMRFGRG